MNSTNDTGTSLISKVCWISTAMLLIFLCVTHLGVQLVFLLNGNFLGIIAPIALIGSILVGDRLGHGFGLIGSQRLLPVLTTISIVLLSILLSALFFDLSWDGQWYHQTAIYKMAQGWNPLFEPMRAFDEHNDLWVRHYTKGTWFVSAALFKTLSHIEPAKAITWITFFAAFMSAFAACLDYRITRLKSAVIAAVVAVNPVTTCSLYSFQVDGILVSLLVCYVAALFSLMRKPSILVTLIGLCAVVFAINTKFTGLVFICFFIAGAGVYVLIWQRNLLFRFVAVHIFALVLGIVVMGYNPYITNTIHRGNPFFPIMGTKEHPGFEQEGADEIEKWETPDNLKGQSRLVRLGYGIFGRPGAQPWIKGKNAELMIPFLATTEDMALYRFMDVRISGLGPYFSGILILSLILAGIILSTTKLPKTVLIIGIVTIVVTLLISNHTWWARYAPQLWWLPIIPALIIFYKGQSRFLLNFSWGILIMLFINATIIAVVHLNWEITSSRALYNQLTELKNTKKKIEVDFQYFVTPVSERFKTWGIPYQAVKLDQLPDGEKLMSVVEGYPGCVLYKPLTGQGNQKQIWR